MSMEQLGSEKLQPLYYSLPGMLDQIPGKNGEGCRNIYAQYKDLFEATAGSSHNHQAWPGGYADHITDAMNIGGLLYDALNAARPLPFPKSKLYFVLFVHDLEKPFKYTFDAESNLVDNPDIPDKAARGAKRLEVMAEHGIEMDDEEVNAFHFVEGIRDHEYTNQERRMGELAALCHLADTASARMWYNHPLPGEQDPWVGSTRVNPAATLMIKSEIYL